MERRYVNERRDGIQRTGRKRWEISYGYVEEGDTAYQYVATLDHYPHLSEVRNIILDQVNEIVKERICSGMTYQGMLVWLSAENQRNISFAYALAKGGDMSTPPTIKLGTDDDYIMYQFESSEEVIRFAVAVQQHIESCIAAGRTEKKSIDWSCYEQHI